MVYSKRPHRKTRTGCSQCKRRKVKCDETKPACDNCVRYLCDCDFALSKTSTSSPTAQPAVAYSGLGLPAGSYTSSISTPEPAQASAFIPSIVDMELLHNWSTSTCHTLSADSIVRTIWAVNVPQIGFKCEYVLRGILALSAQHLAHCSPSETQHEIYSSHGLLHHQTALGMASSALASVNDKNCEALYIFSVLATMYTLAAVRKPNHLLVRSDNGITDWLFFFRGIRSIFEHSYESLLSSNIGPLFKAGSRRLDLQHRNPINSEHIDEFQNLRHLIRITVPDQLKMNIYLEVIGNLEDSISHLLSDVRGYEPGDAFTWLYRASDEYLNLLREQAQEALSIFAFSGVILKNLEFHWWMSGNSAHLLSSIYRLLDKEHRLWIHWPMIQVGWVAINTL